MPKLSFYDTVTNYRVHFYNGGFLPNRVYAAIRLKFKKSNDIGYIHIHSQGSSDTPPSHRKTSDGRLVYFMPCSYEHYSQIIDLLRNEDPIFFHFYAYEGKPEKCMLTTSMEPIGEGEEADLGI